MSIGRAEHVRYEQPIRSIERIDGKQEINSIE